jgi:hypothetical protein
MVKRTVVICLAVLTSMVAASKADQSPNYKGPMSASENALVVSIQTDFNKRFPHASDAEKAGYVRYTGIDETGAISYANKQWTSTDLRHPSQLWYDKKGNLLGADFSTPSTGGKRPNLFGVNPGRWYEFDDHIHYVLKDPKTGKMSYDLYIMAPAFVKAGGDPKHPTAADLVKMKKVKSSSQVVTVFDFPAVWDLIVWVKPNPKGAFAEKNPLVKP